LAAFFGSAARVAVLRVFMLDPTRGYYQRQMSTVTGVALRGIQRELERLEKAGLLFAHREGKRTIYQVDMEFPLFPELRAMVLKTSDDVDRLRGVLALDAGVRIAILRPAEREVLVVATPGGTPNTEGCGDFKLKVMTSDGFVKRLSEKRESVAKYLTGGEDLLGRRNDVIWRHIGSAGFEVQRRAGVP
jgi:hypothetical protein